MKSFAFSLMLLSSCIFSMIACDRVETKEQSISEPYIKHLIDSVGHKKFLACYTEDNAVIIFERFLNNNKGARRLIFRQGYAVFIDSLLIRNEHTFHSAKLNTTYIFKDSSIISIQYAKIIHPSSNWQGQTPWEQPYVTTHKRSYR
jgi:hypothetical protein